MASSLIKSILVITASLLLCGTILSAEIPKSPSQSSSPMTKQPQFEDYPIAEEFHGQSVSVDLSSHPNARTFRTRLRDVAKQGTNFAGHYALVWWGCGNECQGALVVDLRTGRVYGLAESTKRPLESSRGLEFKSTSRLIIVDPPCPKDYNPCVSWGRSGEPVRYYLMEENGLRLIHKIPCKLANERQQCGESM